jgi:rare lipoprotein A
MPSLLKPVRKFLLSAGLMLVASCSNEQAQMPIEVAPPSPKIIVDPSGKIPGKKVGRPYQIKGKTYTPLAYRAYEEAGDASWYGDYFHGRLTANGETFDMNKLTAAHPTMPLPSFVEVTNLDNGKKVVLRVNDRGPFAKGRILDVSKRAAEVLGFKIAGTARVNIKMLGDDEGAAIYKDDIPPMPLKREQVANVM